MLEKDRRVTSGKRLEIEVAQSSDCPNRPNWRPRTDRDYAMKRDTTARADATGAGFLDNWFDLPETILRSKVRGFLKTMIEEELEAVLAL